MIFRPACAALLLAAALAAAGCGATLTGVTAAFVGAQAGGGETNNPATVVINDITRELLADGRVVMRIRFTATDPEGDATSLEVLYRTPGAADFLPATLIEGPVAGQNLAAAPTGTVHTLRWDQAANLGPLPVADVVVRVGSATSAPFTAGNDAPRVLGAAVPANSTTTPLAELILVSYALADGESDACSVAFDFAIGAGPFMPMTLSLGDLTGLSSAPEPGAAHGVIWDSRADMVENATATGVPRNSDQVAIRVTAQDPFGAVRSATITAISVHNNARPEAFVSAPAEDQVHGSSESGKFTVPVLFSLDDEDDPASRVRFSFDANDGQGERQATVSLTDGGPPAPQPVSLAADADGTIVHRVFWRSDLDLGSGPQGARVDRRVRFFVSPADGTETGLEGQSGLFLLNNNEEPSIQSLEQPDVDPITGEVTVRYRLVDGEGDDAFVAGFFVFVRGFSTFTVTATAKIGAGDGQGPLQASPTGEDHVFVWDSLKNVTKTAQATLTTPTLTAQELVVFVLVPIDSPAPDPVMGVGEPAQSAPFVVDNTRAPRAVFPATYIASASGVTNLSPPPSNHLYGKTPITFEIQDDDPTGASYTAYIEFSEDDGATYRPMLISNVDGVTLTPNIRGTVAGLTRDMHTVVWPSRTDAVGTPLNEKVRIRVTPFDSKRGTPAESATALTFDNGFFSLTVVPKVGIFSDRIPIEFFTQKQNPDSKIDVAVEYSLGTQMFLPATEARAGTATSAVLNVAPGLGSFIWNSAFDLALEPSLLQPAATIRLAGRKRGTLEETDPDQARFTITIDNDVIATFAGGGGITDGIAPEPSAPSPASPTASPDFGSGEFLNQPERAIADREGNLYIADTANHRIRFVNRTGDPVSVAGQVVQPGKIATIAGGGTQGLGDGGLARLAQLNYPGDIALEEPSDPLQGRGRLWIADTANRLIRVVGLDDARIGTAAGDFDPSSQSAFAPPAAIAVRVVVDPVNGDKTEVYWVEGVKNARILQLDGSDSRGWSEVAGVPAGNALGEDFDSPTAQFTTAAFDVLSGVTVNADGTLLVAERSGSFGGRIKLVDPTPLGTVTRIAGRGTGSGPEIAFGAPATDVKLPFPAKITADGNGMVYIPCFPRVLAFNPSSPTPLEAFGVSVGPLAVTTVAGSTDEGFPGELPHGDGQPALAARFNTLPGAALDPEGGLLLAQTGGGAGGALLARTGGGRIRRIAPSATTTGALVFTVVGRYGNRPHQGDDPGPETFFAQQGGLDVTPIDTMNPRPNEGAVLAADGSRDIGTLGALYATSLGDQVSRLVVGPESPSHVALVRPAVFGVRAGTDFIYTGHHQENAVVPGFPNFSGVNRIVRWNRDFTNPTLFAGRGPTVPSATSGPVAATQAALFGTEFFAVHPVLQEVYFSETAANRIWRVRASDGILERIAGHVNGAPGPTLGGGIAVDSRLSSPRGLDFDPRDGAALYVADSGNHRILRIGIDPSTGTSTAIAIVAGGNGAGFSGDQMSATLTAQLDTPYDVRVTPTDPMDPMAPLALYIADRNNHRVRRVVEGFEIDTVAGTGQPGFFGDGAPAGGASLFTPERLALDGRGFLYIQEPFPNNRIRRIPAR